MVLAHDAAAYTINRVRLINFHNFVDETIEIRNGGHLFFLGDNASGKTTVLDAVHYVLTAGEDMEFNSAARVAGNREGGRRVQGVIMRYNVDTGPLNPKGGITYAAVEIIGRQSKPTTIAVGMTVRSMEEKVSRWGVVRECPLEDIPFVVEDLQGRRPASRSEMRDFFGKSSGYYSSMGAYQREVAQRFFSNWDVFVETCRLFSMGKAYREIVAHASDYHQLFRRLLPEPRTEMFEQIIEALRTLDQSEEELRALEEKFDYLDGLERLIAAVADMRERKLCLEWLRNHRLLETIQERIVKYDDMRQQREQELVEVEREIESCLERQEQQQRNLDDLKTQDSSGLMNQEREQKRDLEQLLKDLAVRREKHAETTVKVDNSRSSIDAERASLKTRLGELFTELSGQVPDLPFPVTGLIAAVDDAHRRDRPEDRLAALPVNDLRDAVVEASRPVEAEMAVAEHRLSGMAGQREKSEKAIASLEARGEALPEVPGFADALSALRTQMISVAPMYAGLEWAASIDDRDKAAMEWAIGEDVLSTLVVGRDDYEEARNIVLGMPGSPRIAMAPDGDLDIPAWVRESLDVKRSDPDVIRCLILEMESRVGPEIHSEDDQAILRFRSHERRLPERPARLIGQEGRREALQREVSVLRQRLGEAEEKMAELKNQQNQAREILDRLRTFRRMLDTGVADLAQRGQALAEKANAFTFGERELADSAERLEETEQQVQWRQERLNQLRTLIEKEGLDKLEHKMQRARQKLQGYRDQEAEARTRIGVLSNQIKGIVEGTGKLVEEKKAAQELMDAHAGSIITRKPEVSDIRSFVLETQGGERYKGVESVDRALGVLRRDEGVHIGQLDAELRHPTFGAAFGFIYDEMTNELLDRRSRRIHDLTDTLRTEIEEQREIINERTFSLFRKLIMEGLLSFLSQYVRELRTMVKRINRLLGDRQFGQNMYRIQVKEVDRYRRLIEIVEHYNPFETEKAEEELREFFEDHKNELLQTEINEVPEVLDYRNWFHYDLRVHTLDGDGVVMDRKTKSVGSGGEQAVPNYLLILTVADFLFQGNNAKMKVLIFDEAFYGIDAGRRDQIMGFATDLGLQLLVASPDQDGVKQEVAYSTTVLIVKDANYDVHLYPYHWENPGNVKQPDFFTEAGKGRTPVEFGEEL